MKGGAVYSYEYIIFQELLHEYDQLQQKKVETKIKRRLKYYRLAPYNQNRVDYIRSLKNKLSDELRLMHASQYYHKTPSPYAAIEDFDIERMVNDYAKQFPHLSIHDLSDMIGWGVHWLYTR